MQKPKLLSGGTEVPAARLIDEMSRLYYLSRAIHVAAEIGIADHMDDEPLTAETLAERTATNGDALRRLLRFLSAYQVFAEPEPGRFCNTELSMLLREDHPQSVRANLRRLRQVWWSAVGDLEHTVRTGEAAFEHVHGVPFFQYLKRNTDIQQRFDEAMARISDADDAAIAAAYDFSRYKRIVDLGGGRGGLLVQILKRAPDAVGVLFEQPQVLARATRLDDASLVDRCEKVAGDFFESVPGGADCYVIKGVLHDFDDEQCVRILSNCREVVDPAGFVLIANQDLPATIDGPHPNLTMDVQMMTMLGGRERSVSDWSELFRRSGLKLNDSIETQVGFTIV